MLNALQFTSPALLSGLLAIAVPVLIHLALRSRPRRVRFPPLMLMHAVLAGGQRVNRLQNLLLLMLRGAVLALAALLLSGPTCGTRPAPGPAAGGAHILILDDSASTRYRPRYDQPGTLLDELARAAREYVTTRTQQHNAARFALIASSLATDPAFASDPGPVLTALHAARHQPPHAQSLAGALRRAAELVQNDGGRATRLAIFTDLTAGAWRDVQPGTLAPLTDADVWVCGPEQPPAANAGFVSASAPSLVTRAEAPVALKATLRSFGTSGDAWVTATSADAPRQRIGPVHITSDATSVVDLELPPAPPGLHALTLALQPDDLLSLDQQYHLAWHTSWRPRAWVLTASASAADPVVTVLRNLLAPVTLPDEQQRITVRLLDTRAEMERALQDAVAAQPDGRPSLLVVLPAVAFAPPALAHLFELAEGGATLLLVPGSATAPDWPGLREQFSPAPPVSELLPDGVEIRPVPGYSRLLPDAAADDLARVSVRRRLLATSQTVGVEVVARYADNEPAILSQRLGRGRLLWLTTAPVTTWSDLSAQAAGLLIWLHSLADEGRDSRAATAAFMHGQLVREPFASLPPNGLVRVLPPEQANRQPVWVRLSEGRPAPCWPTDVPGVWQVRLPEEDQPRAMYTVNWPAEEFDLRPVTRDDIAARLGAERVQVARVSQRYISARWTPPLPNLTDPVTTGGALLLLVFLLELLVASRRSVQI